MSQLIVGLFATSDQAMQATQELSSIGVAGDQVATVAVSADQTAEVGAERSLDVAAVVAATLREAGLDEDRARGYADAARAGNVLLLVTPQGVPDANVKAVLLTHGALDIDSDAPQPNTLGQAPHLEPGAASPGVGLRDPGAVGLAPDAPAMGHPAAPTAVDAASLPRATVAPADDGYGAQEHGAREGLWQESSKAGTATGVVTGAAAGAAAGSPGGPVGAVIGAVAGAVAGAGIGAAGDAAGEQATREDHARNPDDRAPGARKV